MIPTEKITISRALLTRSDQSLADTFKVLSDVNRYRIFQILSVEPQSYLGDIATVLSISVPVASLHTAILLQAKLLQKKENIKDFYPKLETNCHPFIRAITQKFNRH